MKGSFHKPVSAIRRCLDTIRRQPFGWPASTRLLLLGDPFQGLNYRDYLITLFAKVRKNLVDIHITCQALLKILE